MLPEMNLGWLDTAGRFLIVGFFVLAGVANLTPARIRDHIDRMQGFGTPFPATAFWAGIVLQFAGCALLAADWHAELGVLCLIAFTVLATAIFHRFWDKRDPLQRNASRLAMLSNVAIVGGLLLLLDNVRP
jgi:putative oxidoreductase